MQLQNRGVHPPRKLYASPSPPILRGSGRGLTPENFSNLEMLTREFQRILDTNINTVRDPFFKRNFFNSSTGRHVVSPTPPVGMGLLMVCEKISDFSLLKSNILVDFKATFLRLRNQQLAYSALHV
jgi:hypothetical protein